MWCPSTCTHTACFQHVLVWGLCVCMRACVCVHACMRACVCVHACVYAHACVCAHVTILVSLPSSNGVHLTMLLPQVYVRTYALSIQSGMPHTP